MGESQGDSLKDLIRILEFYKLEIIERKMILNLHSNQSIFQVKVDVTAKFHTAPIKAPMIPATHQVTPRSYRYVAT